MSAKPMRCRNCGYILEHLPENRCPECGRPFDPHDPKSFVRGRQKRWTAAALLLGYALLIPLISIAVNLWRTGRYLYLGFDPESFNRVFFGLCSVILLCAWLGSATSRWAAWLLAGLCIVAGAAALLLPVLS